jgi:hypothetical protein
LSPVPSGRCRSPPQSPPRSMTPDSVR